MSMTLPEIVRLRDDVQPWSEERAAAVTYTAFGANSQANEEIRGDVRDALAEINRLDKLATTMANALHTEWEGSGYCFACDAHTHADDCAVRLTLKLEDD